MKRILLSVVAAMMVSIPAAFSQATKVTIDKDGLLKKIEKSDQDIANPKKMDKPATWMSRAKAYYDAATAVSNTLYDGINVQMAQVMFGDPQGPETVTIGNTQYAKYTYPYFVAYTDETGMFKAWEVTYVVKEGAIDEAIASYKKAYQLDMAMEKGAGKNAEKIAAGMAEIFNYIYKQGGIEYTLGNYPAAGAAFERALEVAQEPAYGSSDHESVSSLAHDTGLTYLLSNNFEKAVKYFTLAEERGYERDGEIYYLLYHAYRGLATDNQPELLNQAKAVLEKGLAKYPDNANIIECLTDVYVALNMDPKEIVPVVEAAIAKDPENTALWNGLGRVYERLGDVDKSIEAFQHVAKLKPDDFVANYSIGILYIRKADAFMDEVNKRTYKGQSEYDAELAKVFDVYKNSVAPLEKAYELNPNEKITLELLKSVTFRLRDTEGMMDKYNKYDALLKAM